MSDKSWNRLSYALLLAIAAVIAVTARDYGITWDEEHHRVYGDLVLNWYTSFFQDRSALSWEGVYLYGGFFDALAQIATRFSPQGVYETRHAVNAVFGILGIVAAYGIGRRLYGAAAGFFTALFLVLTPVYYGHLFNNPKDVPFAALILVSLFCLLQTWRYLPRVPWRWLVALGVAIGLATGVRVLGLFLLGCVALFWGIWLSSRWLPGRQAAAKGSLLPTVGRLALSFGVVSILAWVVMLLWWPWGQVSPLLNPLDALRRSSSYDWQLTVLYKGFTIEAGQLPPSYVPTSLAIALPEFYFAALLAGAVLAIRAASGFLRSWAKLERAAGIALVAAVAAFPIFGIILLHARVYDGIRQILFVVPCTAVLAGVSFAALFKPPFLRPVKLVVAGAVLFSMGLTVVDMAQLHPYEYVYLNRLVAGGFESGSTRFETDYWGASYREGIRWVIQNYHPQTAEPIRVANPNKRFLTGYYLEMTPELRERFKSVEPYQDPNLYLSTTRWNNQKREEGTVLHVVERKGVPLLYVIEVRKPR